jgi:TRAP-type C4-dicarboxylate transport system substrate-binding protein
MRRLSLITVVAILIVTFILGGCAAPAPAKPAVQKLNPTPENPLVLKFSYHTPKMAGLVTKELRPWSEAIEKGTNGRVKITHYDSESLVKLQDQYDALVSGLSDLGQVSTETTPGRFVLSAIVGLPFMFPNARVGGKVYNELLNKYCADTEWKEAKILWCSALSPHQIFSNKPVQKLEDMKGLKFRIEGKIEGWTVEALGGAAAELATPDLQQSLERGIIDGCFLQWAGAMTFGVHQVTKYRTETNLFSRVFVEAMSRQLWDKLPEDIQKVFEANSGPAISEFYSGEYEKDMVGARAAITAYDKKVGNPDPNSFTLSKDEMARWVNAVMPVRDRWANEAEAKKLPAKAMLNEATSLVNKYTQQ